MPKPQAGSIDSEPYVTHCLQLEQEIGMLSGELEHSLDAHLTHTHTHANAGFRV